MVQCGRAGLQQAVDPCRRIRCLARYGCLRLVHAVVAHRQRPRTGYLPKGPPPMKHLLALTLIGAFAAVATPALAAENAQNERMKTCNAQAGDKKGEERKKYMSECLSAEKKKSDNKMAACNTKSKGMKADERKKFMSECMKATT